MEALKGFILLTLAGYLLVGIYAVLFSVFKFFQPLGWLGFIPGIPAFIASAFGLFIFAATFINLLPMLHKKKEEDTDTDAD